MKHKICYTLFSLLFILSLTVLVQSSSASCATKKTKLNVTKLTLTKGNNYTLRVYNTKRKQTVRFVSDDTAVITVAEKSNVPGSRSKSAVITATGTGSTIVRANIYSGKGKLVRTLKTKVQVTPYGVSIKFTHKKVKLEISDTMKLSVIIKPNTSQEMPLFETSNSDIVMVNSKGIITAVAPGEAVITATLLSNGQKTQCQVQVYADEEEEEIPSNTLNTNQ